MNNPLKLNILIFFSSNLHSFSELKIVGEAFQKGFRIFDNLNEFFLCVG